MKVDLDARTLEAMRKLAATPDSCVAYHIEEPIAAIRAFVKAHDSARDAERDEALAVAIVNATNRANGACQFKRLCDMPNPQAAIAAARAARAHIEGERAS